jgi:hypothetical protein
MFRPVRTVSIALISLATLSHLLAVDPDRDFSGKWILDDRSSLTVVQQANLLQCSATRPDGLVIVWTYDLNGGATRYNFGDENRNSKVKWEGPALLINTIASGPRDYSILDRWTLSRDRNVLTVERQTMQGGTQNDRSLVYRREGQPATAFSNDPPSMPQRPPTPTDPADLVIRAGTRIPLSLRNAINTKHSNEGDRVYLDTIYPIVVDNRIVIPRGSYVSGTLTTSKAAGVVKGKGELFIRFDTLTLPNGVTRDFRSRLASADSAHGKVDPKEGTITGERDKAGAARTTAAGAGMGAGIGGLAGAASGHALGGVGIGAAAGAAIGLATAMGRHRPDASLPRGTIVEMLLDRDLYYQPSELGH